MAVLGVGVKVTKDGFPGIYVLNLQRLFVPVFSNAFARLQSLASL